MPNATQPRTNILQNRRGWITLLLIGSCIAGITVALGADAPRYCLPQPSGDAVYVTLRDQLVVLAKTDADPTQERHFSSLRWYRAHDGAYLHTDMIPPSRSLQVSPDGATLVLVGVDSVVRWYRTTTQQIVGRVLLQHPDTPFAADGIGMYLANARPDDGIDLIRVADNVVVATLPTERRVTQIVFHPREPLLVAGEGDTVSFWDTATLEQIHTQASDTTSSMVFSQRGTMFAKAEVGPGLRAPPFESRITVSEVVARTTAIETTYVVADLTSALSFRPDGRRLAVGGGYPPSVLVGEWPWVHRWITIVDTERSETIVDRIQTPFRAIIDIAYASDTTIMVVGANADQEGRICVWDVR